MPLGASLWHYAAELCTLSVTYPLGGSALTDTTDNPSEMCQLKVTDFCLFLHHQSYTILQGPFIPPMAFTSCHDPGFNRLPPDGRASTLTTQPLRLALDWPLAIEPMQYQLARTRFRHTRHRPHLETIAS